MGQQGLAHPMCWCLKLVGNAPMGSFTLSWAFFSVIFFANSLKNELSTCKPESLIRSPIAFTRLHSSLLLGSPLLHGTTWFNPSGPLDWLLPIPDQQSDWLLLISARQGCTRISFVLEYLSTWASPVAQIVKNLPAM